MRGAPRAFRSIIPAFPILPVRLAEAPRGGAPSPGPAERGPTPDDPKHHSRTVEVPPMRGWVIYHRPVDKTDPSSHGVRRFLETAERLGIELDVVSSDEVDLVVTRDDRKGIILRGESVALPDFVLPRTGSGTTYYTLAVIRHLERLGVSSFNPSTSIEVVKDKLYTQQILAQSNFPVPRTMLARYPVDPAIVERQVGFPVIVKTLSGSQGQGVYLCDDHAALEGLLGEIGASESARNLIFQEFIASSRGQDLRVFILGGRAIGAVRRIATEGEFKANISTGARAEAYDLTPEAEWLAAEVARIVGLDIAGIDLLFDGDGFRICEANSSPGFKGIEQVYGIDVPEQVFRYIRIRLGRV